MTYDDPIRDSLKQRMDAGGMLFVVTENKDSQENVKN